MADSFITKKALAYALKELMKEEPLSKISIRDISEKCQMNRKSFYYHFKDKNDLINWIFDAEFLSVASMNSYSDDWDAIDALLAYLYENRSFYRKVLRINDQNCFNEHLQGYVSVYLEKRLPHIIGASVTTEFSVAFWTDAFVCAIKKWLLDSKCLHYTEFANSLKNCIYMTAIGICEASRSQTLMT